MSESNEKPSRKFRALPKSNVVPLWERQLLCGNERKVKKLLANVVLILSNAPEWHGAVGWDEFAERVMIVRECPAGKPGPWSDLSDKLTTTWLQQSKWRMEVGLDLVSHSIEVVAKQNCYHPLRDKLASLRWDGHPRVDTWTSVYLGSEDTLVHQTIGALWMLGAVARAYEPGCQMDSALILEGPQGRGKSTALRILSLGFFTDELADVGSKDAAMQLHGVWIVEIAELDAISRADAAKVKAFLTRRVDRYRAPYGHHVGEHHRQCVFAGSVNHNDYLKDETGGRRFLPVACGPLRLDALRADCDQLWAEAVWRYHAGHKHYIEDAMVGALVSQHTSSRYQGDAWDQTVLEFAQVRESVSVAECLTHLGVEQSRWTQADQNRIAKILKSREFNRKQTMLRGVRTWRYYRPRVVSGELTGGRKPSIDTVTCTTSSSITTNTGNNTSDGTKIPNSPEVPVQTGEVVQSKLSDWLIDQGIGSEEGDDNG